MVDPKSRRYEYPVPFRGPPELADAWARFADTYTDHGRLPYECRSAALLESLALGQGGAGAICADCEHDAGKYARTKRYIEDGLMALGNLTASQMSMRPLHKHIAARLIEQWVEVRRGFGIDSGTIRQDLTHAELEDLDRRCAEARQSPTGGMLAGCLRAAYDTIIVPEAKRLSIMLKIADEECLAQAGNVFDRALFSYAPDKGAQFGTYLTNGIRINGQFRHISYKKDPARRIGYHHDWSCDATQPFAAAAESSSVVDDRDQVARFLDRLNHREKQVLERLFGLKDGIPRNYREIGEELGVSLQRAEAIAKCALRKCRGLRLPPSSDRSPGR